MLRHQNKYLDANAIQTQFVLYDFIGEHCERCVLTDFKFSLGNNTVELKVAVRIKSSMDSLS